MEAGECWIAALGMPIITQRHEPQHLALLNSGLATAQADYRAVRLLAYGYRYRQNWFCFAGSDGAAHWAIASALRPGSIVFGDCGGCPGGWRWQAE